MKKPNQDRFSFRSTQVFIAVTEERSVSGAARRFGCSASTVSNQLANLESFLGVQTAIENQTHVKDGYKQVPHEFALQTAWIS